MKSETEIMSERESERQNKNARQSKEISLENHLFALFRGEKEKKLNDIQFGMQKGLISQETSTHFIGYFFLSASLCYTHAHSNSDRFIRH